jgi:hypothetical protein
LAGENLNVIEKIIRDHPVALKIIRGGRLGTEKYMAEKVDGIQRNGRSI